MSGSGGLAGGDDRPGRRATGDEAPTRRSGRSGTPEPAADDRTAERASAGSDGADTSRTPVPTTQIVGRIALGLLALLFLFFAVANAQPVDFSWVFGETQVRQVGTETRGGVPLIVLLVLSFVIGAAVGVLASRQASRGGRR